MDASDSSPQHSSEEDEEENDSSEEEDDEEEHEDEEEQEEEDDEEEDEEDIGPRAVEITEASVNYKCCFCGRHEINSVEWGVMLKLDDIVLHHFCLVSSTQHLFSSSPTNLLIIILTVFCSCFPLL